MKLTDKFQIDAREQLQRKQFIELDERDIARLKKLLPLVEKHVDEIVDGFYLQMFKFEEARSYFKDERMLQGVKNAQRDYLLDLFRGNYDEAYFEKRLQIGVVHERIGLTPKWYIGGNSIFAGLIISLILRGFGSSRGKLAAIKAVIKIMNLDQQLIIDTYIGSLLGKLSEKNTLETLLNEVRSTALVLGKSGEDILGTATQLAGSAAETAASISQTTATVEEVRQTAQLSSQKAAAVSSSAQQAAEISQSGRQSAADVAAEMDHIREQMEDIAASMVRLSEQCQDIGQIIATVEDMAEQSNLLAVNAAIEAAKAGDQGKGFVVVAQEVRSLADQSKQATHRVRTILNDIQHATATAVMTTEQGGKAVASGVKQTEVASASISSLADRIAEAAQSAMQIAASSQQQLVGMDQLASGMQSIMKAGTQNAASAEQLEEAARKLNELGQRLKQMVEHYGVAR